MKRYSTVHPLYMSFYSGALYRYVGRNWKGTAFLYLLLILVICWIPIMFKMHSSVSLYIEDEAPKIVKQVPAIRISNGEVSVDAEMPYFIVDPDNEKPMVIIDTTGKYSSLEDTEARVLLTGTQLIMKRNLTETRVFDLSQIDYLEVDRTTVYEWIDVFKSWFAIVLYPLLVLFSYAYRIIQALLYAAIGIGIARSLQVSLNYQALLSLAIVANTPAILLNTAYNYSEMQLPFWWLICFIISMSFLFFGIRSSSEDAFAAPQH